jgi:hypothetical protein
VRFEEHGLLGVLLLAAVAATSCGSAQTNAGAQGSADGVAGGDTVMTALRAEKLDAAGRPTGAFHAGDVLGSNQNFTVYFEVDARRYVYAVQFHNGSGEVLYPCPRQMT